MSKLQNNIRNAKIGQNERTNLGQITIRSRHENGFSNLGRVIMSQ